MWSGDNSDSDPESDDEDEDDPVPAPLHEGGDLEEQDDGENTAARDHRVEDDRDKNFPGIDFCTKGAHTMAPLLSSSNLPCRHLSRVGTSRDGSTASDTLFTLSPTH